MMEMVTKRGKCIFLEKFSSLNEFVTFRKKSLRLVNFNFLKINSKVKVPHKDFSTSAFFQ